jgi:hypothetical protein
VRITFDARAGEDVMEVLLEMSRRANVRVASLIWTTVDNQPICVVRIVGGGVEKMLEDLWETGHIVLNVMRGSKIIPPPAP